MGIWRKKNRILARKDELRMFCDSSYNLFNTKPLESISSDIPVAKERKA